MEESIFEIDGDQFVYMPYREGIAIKKYRGSHKRVQIPEQIAQRPVIALEKKAFLSCKSVHEIVLPESIEEIGDWAFAHAEQLRNIWIPCPHLHNGKELFLGCKRLREIIYSTTQQEERENGLSRMLAMAVTVLHDYYLFDLEEVGSDAWIKRWDEKLIRLIELDDLDGFEELWTCGEEDYEGKDYDIKSYPVEKRKMKLRILYFRLLHPYKLSETVKKKLEGYLAEHTKNTQAPEAWDIIIEEHRDELAYYEVFAHAGCVTEDNFDELIADMVHVNAEIKAYMLRYREENLEKKDAFAAFDLLW